MIQSMTAFARVQGQGKWGSAVCEVRSINHRYLEISVRLPESLHELEMLTRERIRHHIKRGKIEFYLRYQPGDHIGSEIVINEALAAQLCHATQKISNFISDTASVNAMDILQWPGVVQIPEVDFEILEDEILELLEDALKKLVEVRAREGEELKNIFLQRVEAMREELKKVRKHIPVILSEQRERLMSRFKDLKMELDVTRLEQEMILFTQKFDVTEEIDRLETHITEVGRILKQGGVVGRRLDFLMQELNREANTLGAKSINVETTRVSVELKVLIEQMREQVQNVE